MEKPYGYKMCDLIALAKFIAENRCCDKPLSESFKEYALLSGKAAGSVRNLYYTLAKFSHENEEFTKTYLGGKPIAVEKSETFSEEENAIINRIKEYKSRGVSVRKATMLLSGGDAKKALRFQNKYRNVVKKSLTVSEKHTENTGKLVQTKTFLFERLKKEINSLADRLSADLKKENTILIRQIAALKTENERLNRELYGNGGQIIRYFGQKAGIPVSAIQRPKNY